MMRRCLGDRRGRVSPRERSDFASPLANPNLCHYRCPPSFMVFLLRSHLSRGGDGKRARFSDYSKLARLHASFWGGRERERERERANWIYDDVTEAWISLRAAKCAFSLDSGGVSTVVPMHGHFRKGSFTFGVPCNTSISIKSSNDMDLFL